MVQPDFDGAALRHISDAKLLAKQQRNPNADHLYGFAAECALKAIIVRLVGPPQDGYVLNSDGKKIHHHVPKLWQEFGNIIGNCPEPAVAELLCTNPFDNWDVADRYTAGTHISDQILTVHANGAQLALVALNAIALSYPEPPPGVAT